MSENNNTQTSSLEDVMGKKPRKSTTVIDVTQPDTINANNVEHETETITMKAVTPVQAAGPVDMENLSPVDAYDILPKKKVEDVAENDLLSKLDAAVDKECESISERMQKLTDIQRQEFEDMVAEKEEEELKKQDEFALGTTSSKSANEASTEDYFEDNTDEAADEYDFNITKSTESHITLEQNDSAVDIAPATKNDITKDESLNMVVEEDVEKTVDTPDTKSEQILDGVRNVELFDDEDEDSETDGSDDSDTIFESLKTEVKKKITPIKKALDLSKFTIAQKSANVQKVMKLAVKSHQNVADWVMYSARRPISMTGLSGPEILKLNPENSSRNRLNTFRDMYRIIYDHIYDGNKPEFETWLKQTRFIDLQHIYFALYMATFSGSNFITYSCTNPKCNKVFIKDIPFEDMVVYSNDEAKKKVKDILKMDTTSPDSETYPVDLVQISDSYVFGLKSPSVWNVIIETASLSDAFLEKHADLIDIVSYIDAIYFINEENKELVPVDTKPDPNDQAKTSARRIKAFYDIISSLSSEDYYSLRARINDYDDSASNLSYKIPACTCPECATEIPANTDISPDNMIFTRHQLAAIGNM